MLSQKMVDECHDALKLEFDALQQDIASVTQRVNKVIGSTIIQSHSHSSSRVD